MPRIIPIRDLKKTSELSELCRETNGEMVIMSMDTYEKTMLMNDIYRKVDAAEQSVSKGDVAEGFESLRQTRKKYDL